MLIYNFLLPILKQINQEPVFTGQARVFKDGDKVLYRTFDDGDICHEQNLLTGNGRYSDDCMDNVWFSPERHQLVSIHKAPSTDDSNQQSYHLAIFSFSSKEDALKQFKENYFNVRFVGYINDTDNIEVIVNNLSETVAELSGWEDFVSKLLEHHNTIDIGISSNIEDKLNPTAEEFNAI